MSENYVTPQIEVIEVELEDVLCLSATALPDFGYGGVAF